MLPSRLLLTACLPAMLFASGLAGTAGARDGTQTAPPAAKVKSEPDGNSKENADSDADGPGDPTPSATAAAEATDDRRFFPVGTRERPLILRTPLPDLIGKPRFFPGHDRARSAALFDAETAADSTAAVQPVHGFPATIAVHFGPELAIAWDSVECRLLYAWRGGFLDMSACWQPGPAATALPKLMGDIVYLADGPAPLSVSIGALGDTRFFGYRLIDGIPEFLYTVGSLKVAERISPGENGKSIVQHFNVERNQLDLMLSVPRPTTSDAGKHDKAAGPLDVINGTRDGDFVLVKADKAGDFTLIHRIGEALRAPDSSTFPTAPIPLLTENKPPPPRARPVDVDFSRQNATSGTAADAEPAAAVTEKMPAREMARNNSGKTTATSPPAPAGTAAASTGDAAPEGKSKPEPVPGALKKQKDKPIPVIASANRYDRDILLTDPHVEKHSLKPGSTAFADRDFKFTEVPEEITGADHVRTFDRDKYIPGDILSYRLKLEHDADVFLLVDARLDPLPAWIDHRFRDTSKTARLDDGEIFRILRASADAGEFRFGPQESGARAHFYLIAVAPRVDTE